MIWFHLCILAGGGLCKRHISRRWWVGVGFTYIWQLRDVKQNHDNENDRVTCILHTCLDFTEKGTRGECIS